MNDSQRKEMYKAEFATYLKEHWDYIEFVGALKAVKHTGLTIEERREVWKEVYEH